MKNRNVPVEITKANMQKFERLGKVAKLNSVQLLNAVLERWLAKNYKNGLTVS